jgi:hypothetical protein
VREIEIPEGTPPTIKLQSGVTLQAVGAGQCSLCFAIRITWDDNTDSWKNHALEHESRERDENDA